VGNPRKPHGLKLIQATLRPDRDYGGPPPAVPGRIKRPAYLDGSAPYMARARALWDATAPALIQLRCLNPMTAPTFCVWCVLMAQFEDDLDDFPAAKMAQLRALGSSYGMDAVAFEKLCGNRKPEEEDPADRYFE